MLDGHATLGEEILADTPGVADFVMDVSIGGYAMCAARVLRPDRDVRVTLLEPAKPPVFSVDERGVPTIEGLAVVEPPPSVDDEVYVVSEGEVRDMVARSRSRRTCLPESASV